jgi:hypothetical protein
MAKCTVCHQGINSTYIRVGEKSLLNKVGYYCSNCDVYYDLNQKPYTKNEKPYTVNKIEKSPILPPFYKTREPWPGFGPGTSALPRLYPLIDKGVAAPTLNPPQDHHLYYNHH